MRAVLVAAALLLGAVTASCAQSGAPLAQVEAPLPRPIVQEFDDCSGAGWCPTMVMIPAGSFIMGSPPNENGRGITEGPQHRVDIRAFAVGKFEITWDQWQACVDRGGCSAEGPSSTGGDNGWGFGSRPVIEVNWHDAQAYVLWLSQVTGANYRLLSESEWEYVARAGTTTRYSWGDAYPVCNPAARNGANFSGCAELRTLPVGTFAPNPFGLFDMHGNVYEWVQDCYKFSYTDVPTNGAPHDGECDFRMLRGGSWGSYPQILRSAYRVFFEPGFRYQNFGIRVARALD